MGEPVAVTLTWQGDLRFASIGSHPLTLDGDSSAGVSPVQLLAFSIAGCMAIDVVDIIRKGRYALTALEAHLVGGRAETPPRRLVSIHLTFIVRGEVPSPAIERAITLSREKYCSVSNSLRSDIEFVTSYEVQP